MSGTNIPERLVECVKQGVIDTLNSICSSKPEFQGQNHRPNSFEGLIGVISFVGPSSISMRLELPKDTAIFINMKFTGFDIEYDSPDMGDIVGELTNVIAGDVSARLDGIGVKNQISLPTIARGKEVEVLLLDDQICVPLHFSSTSGDFWVEITAGKSS